MAERCEQCGHECVGQVTAKCSDLFHFTWPGGKEHDGYVLPNELIGIGGGDYVEFHYCLVCGHIQGSWPVKGASGYIKRYARPRHWEVYLLWEDGHWDSMYVLAQTTEQIDHLIDTAEFRKVVVHKIHDWEGMDIGDDVHIRDLTQK